MPWKISIDNSKKAAMIGCINILRKEQTVIIIKDLLYSIRIRSNKILCIGRDHIVAKIKVRNNKNKYNIKEMM